MTVVIDFSNGYVVLFLGKDRSLHTNLCCNNMQVDWNILISMFRHVNPPRVVTRYIASFAMHVTLIRNVAMDLFLHIVQIVVLNILAKICGPTL